MRGNLRQEGRKGGRNGGREGSSISQLGAFPYGRKDLTADSIVAGEGWLFTLPLQSRMMSLTVNLI